MECRNQNFKMKVTRGTLFDNNSSKSARIVSYPALKVRIKNKEKQGNIDKFIITGNPDHLSFKVFVIFKNKKALRHFLNQCDTKVRAQLYVNLTYSNSIHLLFNFKHHQRPRLDNFFAEIAKIEHYNLRDNQELMQAIGFKPEKPPQLVSKEIKSEGISLDSF